jgi:hypothetical protein
LSNDFFGDKAQSLRTRSFNGIDELDDLAIRNIDLGPQENSFILAGGIEACQFFLD